MRVMRAWKYRIYPSKTQEQMLDNYLHGCKTLWNSLLEYTKKYYKETAKFPTRKQLYLLSKERPLFSQVAQNVADRLSKSMRGMMAKKKAGKKAGFPRFKPLERMKSLTYPQFGFKLKERLELSGIGSMAVKKHRNIKGKVKNLTIKKSPSGKWFAIFTSEVEKSPVKKKQEQTVGIDLGIEHFAYLSDGATVENPRNLRKVEKRLKELQKRLSSKKKGTKNRRKARTKVAIAYENLANRRRDFLHKISRKLVEKYSFIAMENLNIAGMVKSFNHFRRNGNGAQGTPVPYRLAKHVLDCSWAEFSSMLHYKAEEAGCEVVLVGPAHTTQRCSSCGLVRHKPLAERWHSCSCGASMHRDLNAAINILKRATVGTTGSQACGEETTTRYKHIGQVSTMKQEAPPLGVGSSLKSNR